MAEPVHPAMKLARPSLLLGALLLLAGAVVFRGVIELEPRNLWTVLLVTPGVGFLFFGLTVTMAGRVLVAAMNTPEDERPKWDDDEEDRDE
ncbi:hypothetical protein [Maricaulis maris]|jgi:hypothetical protein|uniref:hypothetical protein n=1 Tax=Maricaulis maris TaxID=74318 RepID=UPI00063F32E4|nr:hypothetical protein MACH15_08940 [Maricaulis maris]